MREPERAPGWLLDETAHAGRENLDPDHVRRYDSKEDACAADEVLLCKELGLTGESVVVEIGAGTGQFALAVAPVCALVKATASEDRIEAWCSSTGNTTVDEGWSRAELEEHVRDEHSTFSWLLESMIQRCGFAIEDAVYSDDGIFGKYVLRSTHAP